MLRILPIQKMVVLSLEGTIGSGINTNAVRSIIKKLTNNEKVRGVVLNINSRGGSAGSSEILYRSVKRLVEKKPVVAYFQDIGASGAYEMACPSTKIVAPENCLIGSIGVLTAKISLKKLFDRMGIRLRFIKSGEHKDMFGFHRDLTKEEERMTQKLSDEIYDTFVHRIAENRKIPIEKVRKIADGQVFSGKKAKEIGLIDKNGDLTDAINIASKLCEVPTNRVVHLSPRKPLLQRLLSPIISEFFNSIFDILDETYMF